MKQCGKFIGDGVLFRNRRYVVPPFCSNLGDGSELRDCGTDSAEGWPLHFQFVALLCAAEQRRTMDSAWTLRNHGLWSLVLSVYRSAASVPQRCSAMKYRIIRYFVLLTSAWNAVGLRRKCCRKKLRRQLWDFMPDGTMDESPPLLKQQRCVIYEVQRHSMPM